MARAPFQVLVLPFRKRGNGVFEYALFQRSDDHYWQGIAGGGEDDESPIDAARREAYEEAGMPRTLSFYPLDMKASIPVEAFKASESWPQNLYVIPEHYFAVEYDDSLKVSDEHSEFKWVRYDEALRMLRWDSNKTGLWELNKRLTSGSLTNPV